MSKHPAKARASLLAAALVATIGAAFATTAAAQQYPNKPVRVIVPYAAGGNTDIQARITAEALSRVYNQQFIIENRLGAGGSIAAEAVKASAPDGYTMFFTAVGVMAVLPHLQKVSWDTFKDFTPVSIVGTNGFVLAVHPSLGVKTVKEFVDYVKARPGKLAYGQAGNGSMSHLSGAMLADRAGLDMIGIPYKGGSAAVADMVAGQVAMYFGNFSEVVPHARNGRAVLLAFSGDKRDKQIPEVPTIGETYPGLRTVTWNGWMAPAGTPKDIVDRLSQELARQIKDPAVTERLVKAGVDPWGSTPQEFADNIKRDYDTFRDVVKNANIRVQ